MFEGSEADRLLVAGRIAQVENRTADATALIEQALALEPANPMTLTLWAELALDRRDSAEALRRLDSALLQEPHFAPAWSQRARAFWFLGKRVEGLEAARRAQEIQPNNLQHRIQRAQLAAWMGYRREARSCLRSLRRDATLSTHERALAISAVGEMAIADGRDLEAIRHLSDALRLNPELQVTRMMLGMCQLRVGAFRAGWANYAAREGIRFFYPSGPPQLPGAVWTGQDLRGRSILVFDDQGYGDSIQFFPFLPRLLALGASDVTLLTFPGLERLFRHAAGAIKVLASLPAGSRMDFHCNSTALLRWLDARPDAGDGWAPYLTALPGSRSRPSKARRPQVGLAWSGDPAHTRDHLRSIPAEIFLTLMDVPGITFHSLQPKVRDTDLPALKRRRISRAVEAAADFADTAALIERLDLVIAVDTGVAHLAAAMGKPVWIVLHRIADWRWLLGRDDSPWYPTVRLFRGRSDEWGDGDMGWGPLMARVVSALRGRFVSG